jgi:hypothetical protein
MKGQIIDVFIERERTFRACVLEHICNDLKVVRLDDGKIFNISVHDSEGAIIENIFDYEAL